MDSWWQLGEWSGRAGSELDTHNLVCAFCREQGNFSTVHHEEKRKPNSSKKLNFDTLKCANCAGFLLVLWSASEYQLGGALHGVQAIPRPLGVPNAPEYWPEKLRSFWVQAKSNLAHENWDAAAVMARSALQFVLRNNGAVGSTLKQEIDEFGSKRSFASNYERMVRQCSASGKRCSPPVC